MAHILIAVLLSLSIGTDLNAMWNALDFTELERREQEFDQKLVQLLQDKRKQREEEDKRRIALVLQETEAFITVQGIRQIIANYAVLSLGHAKSANGELKAAIDENNLERVITAFNHFADMNDPCCPGTTFLEYAAKPPTARPEIVKELLVRNADPNIPTRGEVPVLHRIKKATIARLLLEHNADINAVDSDNSNALFPCWRHKEEPEPLEQDTYELVETLCSSKANPNHINNYGDTPLHVNPGHHLGYIRALLKANANVQAEDSRGNTPLHFATVYIDRGGHGTNSLTAALLLINAGADPFHENHKGETPLTHPLTQITSFRHQEIKDAVVEAYNKKRAEQELSRTAENSENQ